MNYMLYLCEESNNSIHYICIHYRIHIQYLSVAVICNSVSLPWSMWMCLIPGVRNVDRLKLYTVDSLKVVISEIQYNTVGVGLTGRSYQTCPYKTLNESLNEQIPNYIIIYVTFITGWCSWGQVEMYLQSNRDILALSFTSNKSNGDRGFVLLDHIHHQDLNLVVIDCLGKNRKVSRKEKPF